MLDKLVHVNLSLQHVLNASAMLQTYEEKKKDNLTYRQTRLLNQLPFLFFIEVYYQHLTMACKPFWVMQPSNKNVKREKDGTVVFLQHHEAPYSVYLQKD